MPNWTDEQKRAIELRNRRLLVSAAAGSGKTAVLTERIVQRITDAAHPVDADRLLVMTFTRAAAAEMRERIRKSLEDLLEKIPEKGGDAALCARLRRQAALIDSAAITTIDSFCLSLIREHADRTDLDPAFRVGSEEELLLMRQDVMDEVLEAFFEEDTPAFDRFSETFSGGKTDSGLRDRILKIWQFSESMPWPEEWLEQCAREGRDYASGEKDCMDAPWAEWLAGEIRQEARGFLGLAARAKEICAQPGGPFWYLSAIQDDEKKLRKLSEAGDLRSIGAALDSFGKWTTFSRKPASEPDSPDKDTVKDLRERWKKGIKAAALKIEGLQDSEELRAEFSAEAETAGVIRDLVLSFRERYTARKRAGNLLDFSDLEHLALSLLWEEKDGIRVPSAIAEEYRDRFDEIYVDEYQDSNEVQEQLIRAMEHGNLFLVGDVKQSIYAFRQARPKLFTEKYRTFRQDSLAAEPLPEGTDTRVDLRKNFRSRKEVLDSCNAVFSQLMAPETGGILYDSDAALYPGAEFPAPESPGEYMTELLLTSAAASDGDEERPEIEAGLIAGRIRELTDPDTGLKLSDRETGTLRPLAYGDIVILLRALRGRAEQYVETLAREGIPAVAEQSQGYFDALEIRTVLSLLSAADDPLNDIALAAVLHSPLCGLTDEELALLTAEAERAQTPERSAHLPLYYRLQTVCGSERYPEAAAKLRGGLALIRHTADQAVSLSVAALLRNVLEETGYYDYASALPGGAVRRANLDMLVAKASDYEQTGYRGLFDFVRYIETLKKYDRDFGEASGAAAGGAVRILSIHKSKGLEFPVVFLAGMNKQFNIRDSSEFIVCDPEFGLAADVRDAFLPVKRSSVKKQILAGHLKAESLGEELRVLYVAMTRAKEKLILTAAPDDADTLLAPLYGEPEDRTASMPEIRSARSFLDWILLAMRGRGDRCRIRTEVRKPELLNAAEAVTAETVSGLRKALEALKDTPAGPAEQALFRHLAAEYGWTPDITLHTSLSVSQLKHRNDPEEEEVPEAAWVPEERAASLPETVRITEGKEDVAAFPDTKERAAALKAAQEAGMARGTLYHKVMELLDYSRVSGTETLEGFLKEKTAEGIFTPEEAEILHPEDFASFFRSGLYGRMKTAALSGKLHRESPFRMTVPAREVDPAWDTDEPVMIQGIIDAWFEEDGEIVLVDYKTDRGISPEELGDRYRIQLDYYVRALEAIEDLPVKERMLWSFALGREIKA